MKHLDPLLPIARTAKLLLHTHLAATGEGPVIRNISSSLLVSNLQGCNTLTQNICSGSKFRASSSEHPNELKKFTITIPRAIFTQTFRTMSTTSAAFRIEKDTMGEVQGATGSECV